MSQKTEYIAQLSLWVVVRKRFLDTGLFVEPAWVGNAQERSGPVIFVSRLLAELYAHLRNTYHGRDDSNNWRAIALSEFDLLEHAHGVDGPLHCMMAFGFSMEDADNVVCITAPRIRYVPLTFNVSADAAAITFSFNQWVFDFARDEWASIGLLNYESELERVDELDDISFRRIFQTAVARLGVCRNPSNGQGIWGTFSVQRDMWLTGDEGAAAVDRDLH